MFRKLRHPLALVAAIAACASFATAAAADDGKVRFVRNANSSFDSILTGSNTEQRQWMASHYWRMRGYAPFFNQALSWAPQAHFYKDLYALYTSRSADQQLAAEHPDWVLRDADGNRLFIQFACNGTSCSQWAADVGNPAWRAHWISKAREVMGQSYAGIFIDDVNLEMKVSDGAGKFVRPIDPRTGAPMTDANWRRYVAEFAEQIKAAFPAKEIVHNPLWWLDHTDPYVQRQTDAADMVELERGFNDGGIVGGTGKYGYVTLLAHIDWLHSRDASAMFEPSGLTATSAEFELASYFLVKAMNDTIVSDYQANPTNWWTGWDTDLGSPAGGRYAWNELIRRDFADGTVFVNQPGATTKTVALPSGSTWTDLAGRPVTSVTLGARQGKVLRKAGSTPPPPPPPDATPPDTISDPEPPTIKPGKGRYKKGQRIALSGSAPTDASAPLASASTVVNIQRRGRSRWVRVKRVAVADGRYRAKVRARRAGTHRYRAVAGAQSRSRVVRVRVRR